MAAISTLALALAAVARCKGDLANAYEIDALKPHPKAATLLRAAIATGTLAPDASMFGDFITAAPSVSIIAAIDRISPFRRTKPGTAVLVDLTPPTASWRAEGAPIVVTGATFTTVRLAGDKSIAGISLYTIEAGRELGDTFVRQLGDDMASSINNAESSALLDPQNDGTGTAPAAITHDAITIPSSGADADSIRADLAELLSQYGGDLSRSVWAVSAATAVRFALLGDALGDADVNVTGGFLAGLPLVSARGVLDDQVTLLDPSGIVVFDDGVRFDTSTQTILDTGAGVMVSLFDENLGATRFMRALDWQVARPDSVATLTGIAWSRTPTP